jgi:hypothetical protein
MIAMVAHHRSTVFVDGFSVIVRLQGRNEMTRMTMLFGALLLVGGAACKKKEEAKPAETKPAAETPKPAENPTPEAPKPAEPAAAAKLIMDVHHLGAGKVKAADVAEAHKKDLAEQGKHGVEFVAYWVDEKAGDVYCLSKAPNAEAVTETHKVAHGLLPAQIMEVTADAASWTPTAGKNLYMDVHEMGAGKVKAADVAGAHQKDLAAQDKHGVKFLNYWVDEASGNIYCLSEAAKPEDVTATHKEAHGLLPKTIALVTEGR